MPPNTSERSRNQSLALGVWTGLALIAALLGSRRFAGQFPGPVPAGLIALWMVFVSTASAVAWWLCRSELRTGDQSLPPRITGLAVAVAFLASWAGAPGLTPLQTGIFIGLWCLSGLLTWSVRHGESLWMTVPMEVPLAALSSPIIASTRELVDDDPVDESVEDADALQTMSRRSGEEGEVIEGFIRVTLPAGERDATVHVSFCPPLATTPTVELEDVDGLGWELKVAAAYAFGLRLQIRRGGQCAEEATGRIAYWALAEPASRAA